MQLENDQSFERPKPYAIDELSDSSNSELEFDHMDKFTKKICSMTLEDILKMPQN